MLERIVKELEYQCQLVKKWIKDIDLSLSDQDYLVNYWFFINQLKIYEMFILYIDNIKPSDQFYEEIISNYRCCLATLYKTCEERLITYISIDNELDINDSGTYNNFFDKVENHSVFLIKENYNKESKVRMNCAALKGILIALDYIQDTTYNLRKMQ